MIAILTGVRWNLSMLLICISFIARNEKGELKKIWKIIKRTKIRDFFF
jgi:hypothetical protein